MKFFSHFFLTFILISTLSLKSFGQLEPVDLDYATLKSEFNAIKDKPRILSILSVNCPPCVEHRNDIRDIVMNQCDNPDLRWFIIWFEDPAHSSVRSEAVTEANLINDSRVKQWWYEEYQSSTPKNDSICYDFGLASWLTCSYPWDISMLYDKGAEWTGIDPPSPFYCMAKTPCCSSFSVATLLNRVHQIDACDSTLTTVNSETNDAILNFEVFPNPTSRKLNINFGKQYEELEIQVKDIQGRTIEKRIISDSKNTELYIDSPPGLYILQINTGHDFAVFKVLIE